jgi:hypothetical protein
MPVNQTSLSRREKIQAVIDLYSSGKQLSFYNACPAIESDAKVHRLMFRRAMTGERCLDEETNVRINKAVAAWLADRNILFEGFLDLYTEESLSRLKDLVLKGR